MATQDLEKLIIRLDADLRQYEKALAKANGVTVTNMRKIEKQAQASATRVQRAFTDIGKTFLKGFIAGSVVEGIRRVGGAMADVANSAARIGQVAEMVGLTTDELQTLSKAGVTAGLSFEDLEQALGKFVKAAAKARTGGGPLADLLTRYKLKFTGDTFTDLKTVADLIAAAKDEETAASIASMAFGNNFGALIEVFKNGGPAFDDLLTKLREQNKLLDAQTIKETRKTTDELAVSWDDLGTAVSGVSLTALNAIWEAMKGIGEAGVAATTSVRKALSFIPGVGIPQDMVFSDTRPNPADARARRTPPAKKADRLPVVTLPTQEDLDKLAREKELREDLIDTVREYNEARAEAVADSIKGAEDEIRAMEAEGRTVGMTTAERETYLKQQELINLAIEKGIVLTPQLMAKINATAEAYGNAAGKLERLQNAEAQLQELRDLAKDSMQGFFTDIANGIEPVDALTDALKNLANQLLRIVMNAALTDLLGGQGGGGAALGGALASLVKHKGGLVDGSGPHRLMPASTFRGARRFHNGLGPGEFPAVLQKGEMVLPRGFRAGGSSGDVTIVDQRRGGEPIRGKDDGRGGKQFFVRDAIRSEMAQFLGGDQGAKLMNAKYGLTPRVTSR